MDVGHLDEEDAIVSEYRVDGLQHPVGILKVLEDIKERHCIEPLAAEVNVFDLIVVDRQVVGVSGLRRDVARDFHSHPRPPSQPRLNEEVSIVASDVQHSAGLSVTKLLDEQQPLLYQSVFIRPVDLILTRAIFPDTVEVARRRVEPVDAIQRGVIQARIDIDESAATAANHVETKFAIDEPCIRDPSTTDDTINGL